MGKVENTLEFAAKRRWEMHEAKQLFAPEEDSQVNHTVLPLLFLHSGSYLFGLSVDFLYVQSLLIF